MAIRSGFFNSVNGDRKYDAKRFAEYFASFIGNGVFPDPSDGLQVVANDDMTVTVKAGKCWINGYIMINDDDYILEIDPADGVLNRIDRVVARYDVEDREIRLEVKKGDFATNAVAKELQRDADAYELGLADIYVAAGSISISQADITDLRLNSELCGIVKGTVDQIDTTGLFAQYQAAFEDWFQDLQDVLDDNTAANLLNLINQLDDDLTSHKAENANQHGDLATLKTTEKTNLVGAINEVFQSGVNLKNTMETEIIAKEGTVSKVGEIATQDELVNGIRSIPVGDYKIGDIVTDNKLKLDTNKGRFKEIYSNSELPYVTAVAVDSERNIYCGHVSGVLRKLDNSGNELWNKTLPGIINCIQVDVEDYVYCGYYGGVKKISPTGKDIWARTHTNIHVYCLATDKNCNVYYAYSNVVFKLDRNSNELWSDASVINPQDIVTLNGYVYIAYATQKGAKTIRKLRDNGTSFTEIWSKTDADSAHSIDVDDWGNVYCGHQSNEMTIRKLNPYGGVLWTTKNSRGYIPKALVVDGGGNVYWGGEYAPLVKTHHEGVELSVASNYGAQIYQLALDSEGILYVPHKLESGKTLQKIDGKHYYTLT